MPPTVRARCSGSKRIAGPYGHDLLLHHYESVLLIAGGTGVTYIVPFLHDLVRRARNLHLGGTTPLVTSRLTFVWSIRNAGDLSSIESELANALHYAPPGFLDLQVYVTSGTARIPLSTLHDSTVSLDYTATNDSHAWSEGEKLSGGIGLPVVNYRLDSPQEILLPTVVRPQRSDSLPSFHLADSPALAPATPSAPTVAAFDPSSTAAHPSILAPSAPLGPSPASSTHNALPIPTLHGRPRVRDLLAATIARTPRAGSVAVATCGPTALTDEVGAACSDAIDPAKVFRGEHRVNVMLHAETFGW
ncbi:uncharacterized protein JCM10292_004249 [Rhodotorula paludigena]|uniref:uncharacterized protein n=1 Tax=Rhodotorula paludigena TaxID=86838 RepID=UPI00317DBA0F